ncbi:hypothetical protein BN77_4302 [Rhizobium mesoamericanum STM3625]|uniref:Uncharacterized protein n=1 Tax=Rhizobium mesoamericanum STM3625 TaxID=1211777 RepID=K0Q3I2_9HYPH|nr:hypothetical protein BN77_4302 [Rhizobium mesoamericanum STM3625]
MSVVVTSGNREHCLQACHLCPEGTGDLREAIISSQEGLSFRLGILVTRALVVCKARWSSLAPCAASISRASLARLSSSSSAVGSGHRRTPTRI